MKRALAVLIAFTLLLTMSIPANAYVKGEIPRVITEHIYEKIAGPFITIIAYVVEVVINIFNEPFEEPA